MSRRFVAGETLDEAVEAARKCNDLGMLTSLDYLGENVATTTDAQRARDAYLEIFDRIAAEKLDANVSCKLTQMGLDLSAEFCEGLVLSVVERAASYNNFLRVDMEGSIYTQRTVELVTRIRARTAAVFVVLHRSRAPRHRRFRSDYKNQALRGEQRHRPRIVDNRRQRSLRQVVLLRIHAFRRRH